MALQTRDAFVKEFQEFRQRALIGAFAALFGVLGIMLALLPVAPAFRHFFREVIGGDVGDSLLGLSFPLIASPPAIALCVWVYKRSKRPALRCALCNYSFAGYWRFVRVRDTGCCPKCGAEQFSMNAEQPIDE